MYKKHLYTAKKTLTKPSEVFQYPAIFGIFELVIKITSIKCV